MSFYSYLNLESTKTNKDTLLHSTGVQKLLLYTKK